MIKLYKKFADGGVRSIEVNETPANMKVMLSNGFFLTEDEASTGKVKADEPAPAPAPAAKPAAKKPAPKRKR